MTKRMESPESLPASFTSFVGRRQEMEEVRRLLGSARLVTLTGAGGVGKTRLALAAVTASAMAFPDGVWFVDLTQVSEPVAVPGMVAAALGLADKGIRPVDRLAVYLSGRRALLVLDNCEHVVDACAQLAQQLLSATAELRLVATSREVMGLTGEYVLPVAPLAPAEAVELLVDRIVAVRPGFRVTVANQRAVARLCADLDGLPLAIELAATRVRTLSVEQVAERLEDRFAFLTVGSRTARPHQRTLRAAIDWSWELCGPAERLLWRRLSVFAQSFTLDGAEAMCAGDGKAAGEVLDSLDRLVAQSLVEHAGGEDPPRYRLLESIRQYGWERLMEAGEDQLLLRRHHEFYVALADRLELGWFGSQQAEILTRLRAEHGNLLAALEYPAKTSGVEQQPRPQAGTSQQQSTGPDPGQSALALALALNHHWVAGGFLGEGRRQLERALDAAAEPTQTRARALVVAAYVAQTQHDLGAADRWLDEAEEIAQRLGDASAHANAQGQRGVSALYQGRLDEATSLLEQAVSTHMALGDLFREVTWRSALAIVQTLSGDPRAPETSQQALRELEASGERWARAHLLMTLGRRAWGQGEQVRARELTVSALDMLRGFSDAVGVAKMVEQLAWITASDGDLERAGCLMGAARAIRSDTGTAVAGGDPRDVEYHAWCEAEVHKSLGPARYERALAAGAAIGSPTAAIAYAVNAAFDVESAEATVATPLTRREQQVAALVAQGMTNRRIASELVLSPRTVDGHVDRILTKLDFSSRAQIAAWWTTLQLPTR